MSGLIASLGAWNWLIAGGLLLAVELAVPGMFMMWLGLAALLVGIISLFVDWPWQAQLVAFAVFTLASIPLWRHFARRVEHAPESPYLNRRAAGFVGHVFALDKPIVNGVGTVRVDDTVWRVHGPELPAGTRVRVARSDGAVLYVEAEG
jgi:membrane protein implicated in regulation of membrane protease activity